MIITDHEKFMRMALKQAQLAYDDGEIPVGAVVVCNNKLISKGYNQMQRLNDPTAHSEMIAITAACNYFGAKYLPDCTLYVTIEPCVMCAGAIKWSQISTIVYGSSDSKAGFGVLTRDLFSKKIRIIPGILETECRELMLSFFDELRMKR
jgi:tRNA(adenine34) deaminase